MNHYPYPDPHRDIFCNRTLNLRSIQAIGYDMDYTLIQYRQEAWETRAYEHLRRKFLAQGWPVGHLHFDAELVERGLVLDLEQGNLLKVNRFGYVKQAYHGTTALDFDSQRRSYTRAIVSLSEPRYVFINTLFSLSEGCMYAQLVDLLDAQRLPKILGYMELYREVKRSLDEAHMEGELKAEIIADPDAFVMLDPEIPLALLDQLHAGKKLMLITNSEWFYTQALMSYAFDRFLPAPVRWRDLFELVIVSARKPSFFAAHNPMFEVMDQTGLLKPLIGDLRQRGVYFGGNAKMIEDYLALSGDEILYVGDHLFTDVHASKAILRWRTALILWELEGEMQATQAFNQSQRQLSQLMAEKRRLEYQTCQLKLAQQRQRAGYGPASTGTSEQRQAQLDQLRHQLKQLDERIAPLAQASARMGHAHWGPMMRAGNDKSLLARQVERYADIYMSRVSNFTFQSPFVYLRSPRGGLPHDP